jgi:DNA-binding MarR family transcriptional regulator
MMNRRHPNRDLLASSNMLARADNPYRSAAPTVLARMLIAHIHRRSHYLPAVAVEDPQWLMTLELFLAAAEGRAVSVSSLCFASRLPSTTALRHIRALEERGFFKRMSHPHDRRIWHVRLSDGAREQVERYLLAISSGEAAEEDPPLRAAH